MSRAEPAPTLERARQRVVQEFFMAVTLLVPHQRRHLAARFVRQEHRHQMSTQSLVLSRDPEVLGTLEPVLAQLGFGANVCTAPPTAQLLLAARQFNPVIVDCEEMDGADQLLQKVHALPPNVESLALAIVRGAAGMQRAFRMGAALVLWKPVVAEEAARVLRTARGLISRMRRRCSRAIVNDLTFVRIEGLREDAMILDLGEGGMGIQALDTLQPDTKVHLSFVLPGGELKVETAATVTWGDRAGRVGVRFEALPEEIRLQIREWISRN